MDTGSAGDCPARAAPVDAASLRPAAADPDLGGIAVEVAGYTRLGVIVTQGGWQP